MRLGDGALPRGLEMSCPQAHRHRRTAVRKQCLHRGVRRPPDVGHTPATRDLVDLGEVCFGREDGDVDEVAQAPQRLVRPGMDGKHDGVPEQAFYLQGTIDDVLENAEKMKQ